MYIIDTDENTITELEERTFSSLEFTERYHLQEWIAQNPKALKEDLLIIQKEFSGFDETNERLDLLALDKFGNLVVIENKLDDSGKDVTWQAIKYASYCSGMTKQEIIDVYQDHLGPLEKAEEKISEFYDGKEIGEISLNNGLNTQRIMLIAAKFRKEVTSTVLWLMNYNMRIQCFKVTPYALNKQLFLNVDQILPTVDAESFSIKIASKAQQEIAVQETLMNSQKLRQNFWTQFIQRSNKVNSLFSNISASKDNWIGIGIGMTGVNLNVVISKNHCRCEIYFNRGGQEENKYLFDYLFNIRNEIELDSDIAVDWERMSDKVSSRIKSDLIGVSYFEESDWEKMIVFLIRTSEKMVKMFKQPVKKMNQHVKNKKS